MTWRNFEQLFYILSAVFVAIVFLIAWRRLSNRKRKLKYGTRLSDDQLRRLVTLALQSHSEVFVNLIIRQVSNKWGDGKEYRRLQKHLTQGVQKWIPPVFPGYSADPVDVSFYYPAPKAELEDPDFDLSEFE